MEPTFGKFAEKYYPDGILMFEGTCKSNVPNGYGRSYYKNGKIWYEGMWANGLYHGNGTMYDENGNIIYNGEWVNGHRIGETSGKKYSGKIKSEKLNQYMEQLNSLIGLMEVKKELNTLINFVKLQHLRKERGLKIPTISLHMVFTGNPGTGKTTVARLVSKILYELGYLSKGHMIETNRAGMVAGYLGQTAIKTEEVIRQSIGGVLFIDEAYTLANDDWYGQEAIDTLLKMMEDCRDNLVVIVAGYPELMKKFIGSNPGLYSRFSKYIEFKDYTKEELWEIFDYICKANSYSIDEEAGWLLKDYLEKIKKDEQFGNARAIRNIFEQSIALQANRVMNMEKLPDDISLITKADIIRFLH